MSAQPNGRVEKRLLARTSNVPRGPLYACQSNAWMDELVMLIWIDIILKPYLLTAPENIVPIIFLDSYRCHMMGSVVRTIEELGCEVMHIPGGCTCVLQPVDVGFNKPLKAGYRKPFHNWLIQQAIIYGKIDCPTRE